MFCMKFQFRLVSFNYVAGTVGEAYLCFVFFFRINFNTVFGIKSYTFLNIFKIDPKHDFIYLFAISHFSYKPHFLDWISIANVKEQ